LDILQKESDDNNELILDSNAELSRALVVLINKSLKTNKKFVVSEIKKHYIK